LLGYVNLYSPTAKEVVRNILEDNLGKYNVEFITDNILTIVDELVKNGIKANYKYILIREEIEKYLESNKSEYTLEDILKDRELYSDFATNHINFENITSQVRIILSQESKVISLKTKVNKEKRRYLPDERKQILEYQELIAMRRKIKKYKTRVQVRVNEYWGALNIEIMNTAPILQKDLDRIESKRKEFKSYADKGEEVMFFVNNMDNTDGGAGLGYATIDSSIKELGIDPFETISILSVTNTTVLLYIKINQLKKLAVEKEEKTS